MSFSMPMKKVKRLIQHKRVPRESIEDYLLRNNSGFLFSLADGREENRKLLDLRIV